MRNDPAHPAGELDAMTSGKTGAAGMVLQAMTTQYLSPRVIESLQLRKLRRRVLHAYNTIPLYRHKLDSAGIAPGDLQMLKDIRYLPVMQKEELLGASAQERISRAFSPNELHSERTTGTSGHTFDIVFEGRWQGVRQAMFLRALFAAGYRPGSRIILLTPRERAQPPSFLGWRYFPHDLPAPQFVEQLNTFRPHIVYGRVTPLRVLAGYLVDAGIKAGIRSVVTTAEALDNRSRALLQDAFGAPVYDIYGLTESGALGWECREHAGYHLSEDVVITEFDDAATSNGARPLLVTNLDLFALPIIRYACGDLVTPGLASTCACGRRFRTLARLDGRSMDAVRLADGSLIAPTTVLEAIESIPGVFRYQLVQEDIDRLVFRFLSLPGDERRIAGAARAALQQIAGSHCVISISRVDSLEPSRGQKYRLVVSELGRL
jgi:phenylacetate-coenzyme A ligase PaaK-like adenylate-forming protein